MRTGAHSLERVIELHRTCAAVVSLSSSVEKSTNQLLRLHEALDLRRHGARAHVMRDTEERRFVDERSCRAASALSRSAGSKATRTAATSLSYSGSLMKPQLLETGGAILLSRKRIMAKNGSIAA